MSVTVNYLLLAAIAVPSAGGIFVVVKRAIGADDSLEEKYGEKRRRAHTTLMSQFVSQSIGEILVDIDAILERARYEEALADDRSKAVDMVSDALQHRSLNERLKLLTSQCGDDLLLQETRTLMKRDRTVQAICMIPVVLAEGLLCFWISESGLKFPEPLIVVCSIALTIAISVFLTFGWLELLSGNRLSRMIEKFS